MSPVAIRGADTELEDGVLDSLLRERRKGLSNRLSVQVVTVWGKPDALDLNQRSL